MIKEEFTDRVFEKWMDYSKFSKPPKRNSKNFGTSVRKQKSRDVPRNPNKAISFLPAQHPQKQNTFNYSRSTKQIKFDVPEIGQTRAQGGRSRSILMASSGVNAYNLNNHAKTRSRWEDKQYEPTQYQKPVPQFSSSYYKSSRQEVDIDAKYRELENKKSFQEKLNQLSKKQESKQNFMSSTFYRKDASKSKGKFSNTFTSSRVTDKKEELPFFNQSKVMHETYHHPVSSAGFGKSQVMAQQPYITREKNKSKMEIPLQQPKLSDFLIGQCKGQGRFGKVYLAVHKRTGFLCALKKIRKDAVRYMIEQFIQQIKIQLFLNHSKLVKMYGYFSDNEHFYMLIEYMEEGSLYSLMKKVKKFQQSAAIEKIHEICEGIKEMHENNIVHRDLKPQNVVMSYGVCKVCDFGWAAICQGRRQTYCGTLDYVCPEIIEGTSYDSSVDIWCLGVLAYQMLCGKAPFYDISRKKTMEKIVSCKIETFPTHFSQKAKKFIEMALQKDPVHRVGVQELLQSDFLKGAKI